MPRPPNILVIMTDDHAAWSIGCYGNRVIPTPNLDMLAHEGARATAAYTPSPVCSPARACFFTGQIPSQHGIHDWLLERPESPRTWLNSRETLPPQLQDAGYRTGLVGKWHCGNSHLPQPGFEFWLGYARGQYPHHGPQSFICNGEPETHDGPQSPYLTSRAIDFLGAKDDRPFFLFLGLVDTHSPFRGHSATKVREFREQAAASLPRETYAGPGGIKFGDPSDENRRAEWGAQYFAAVSTIDEQVGRIVASLKEAGKLDNTLILYTSDHGHMNGHHGLYTKGNATVPQNFYDEAIQVPLILRHPPSIPARSQPHAPIDHCDLFATVRDYAGISESTPYHGPGRSIKPLLAATDPTWRKLQFCEYGNARMVRSNNRKLIIRQAPHDEEFGDELYDLAEDPRETSNVINDPAYRSDQAALRSELENYFERWEDSEHSGRHILTQPAANSSEPWRIKIRPSSETCGSDWAVLDHYPSTS